MIILEAIVLGENAWLISDVLFLFLCQVFLVFRWQG